ncbi:hypothetical protein EOPP23_00440 [Endozoicomonas sp. OPT23]|uniref:hypothetical protein n=1 Tax=Endozoicomonas sp. OPT23 TaxID=2072845 RepID=UPI00129BA402|nr:hypothetical protein [Endozoicomonas sp. OPT23]MRI31457.1 hypothetical protein [Endozoicomonas sp. OPT23]
MSVGGPTSHLPANALQTFEKHLAKDGSKLARLGEKSGEIRFGEAKGNWKQKTVRAVTGGLENKTVKTANNLIQAFKNDLIGKPISERHIATINPDIVQITNGLVSGIKASVLTVSEAYNMLNAVHQTEIDEGSTYARTSHTHQSFSGQKTAEAIDGYSTLSQGASSIPSDGYDTVRFSDQVEESAGYSTLNEARQMVQEQRLTRTASKESLDSAYGTDSEDDDPGYDTVRRDVMQARVDNLKESLKSTSDVESEDEGIEENMEPAYGNVRYERESVAGLYGDIGQVRKNKTDNLYSMMVSQDSSVLKEKLANTGSYEILKDMRKIATDLSRDSSMPPEAIAAAKKSITLTTARMSEVRAEEYFSELGGMAPAADRENIADQVLAKLQGKKYNKAFINQTMTHVQSLVAEFNQLDIDRGLKSPQLPPRNY